MKVYELLNSPEKWAKGNYSFTRDGQPVRWNHPGAIRWCVMGAIYKCYGDANPVSVPNAPQFKTISVGEKVAAGFRGYLKVKSDTPVALNELDTAVGELQNKAMNLFVEVPVKEEVSAVRMNFSEDASLLDRCYTYIDCKAPEHLSKDYLKQILKPMVIE